MTSVEQHLARVLALATRVDPISVRLQDGLGLVLAETINAKFAVPPFSNSAMDGYAVKLADLVGASPTHPIVLPVAGDIPAGSSAPPLSSGTVQRIMTGSPIPEGTEAIVPVEYTDQPAGPAELVSEVTFLAEPKPGQHIRLAGENCQAGDEVLVAGEILTAAGLAACASVGFGQVSVYPCPKVAVLSTGDELVCPGESLTTGKIPDSNSLMLGGLVRESGGEPVLVGHVSDNPEKAGQMLRQAASQADLVITSGGVSAGAYDVIKQVKNVGEINFDKVAQQPGKPQGWGFLSAEGGRKVPLLSFPGNPIGAFVSFQVYARPVLAKLAGRPVQPTPTCQVVAGASWSSPAKRRQFTPVKVAGVGDDGLPVVVPVHKLHSGSHLVASLHLADGLAVTSETAGETCAGDELEMIQVNTLGKGW